MRQLDLFHDNSKTVARNELRAALSARDSGRSRIALERLSVLDPLHGLATDVRTLIAVMEAPTPEGQEQGFERIHSLEQKWLPAAEALLGADGSRDFQLPCGVASAKPSNRRLLIRLFRSVMQAGPTGKAATGPTCSVLC